MNKDILFKIIREKGKDKWETSQLLIEYYKAKNNLNIFKASELAEKSKDQFIEFFNKETAYYDILSIEPLFQNATNKDITHINLNYFIIEKIKEKLYKNISDYEFEKLCGNLFSTIFSTKEMRISPKSGDGGYDFYARVNIPEKCNKSSIFDIEIYGQSKKYKQNIDRPEIDKFLGAPFRKALKTVPVLFVFATSSDFTEGAYKYANEQNIICLNGLQIASLIYRNLKNNDDIDLVIEKLIE